jgi:hypothetical protein
MLSFSVNFQPAYKAQLLRRHLTKSEASRLPAHPSEAARQGAVIQLKHQLVKLQNWAGEVIGDVQQVLAQGLRLQGSALHLPF